jgi:hypothetical protein
LEGTRHPSEITLKPLLLKTSALGHRFPCLAEHLIHPEKPLKIQILGLHPNLESDLLGEELKKAFPKIQQMAQTKIHI